MNEALIEIMREYASDGGNPEIAQKARAELERYRKIEAAAREVIKRRDVGPLLRHIDALAAALERK